MASNVQVVVSADISSFAKDMTQATREANKFAHEVHGMGSTLTRTGRIATSAAMSLGNLASVLPRTSNAFAGLASVAAVATGALGTAGVVMGETATISAGLTKAWALLSVSGAKLLALPFVSWLGPIAIGIAATAVVVTGLAVAFSKLTKEAHGASNAAGPWGFGPHVLQFQVSDTFRPGRRENPLLPAPSIDISAKSVGGSADFVLATHLVKTATDEWKDAVQGLRPVTNAVVSDWAIAMDQVKKALANTVNLTKDEITELFRMKEALKDVQRFAAPLTTSEAAGQIRKDIIPTKSFGFGLDPSQFLGDAFKHPLEGLNQKSLAIEEAIRSGLERVTSAIINDLPLRLSMLIQPRTAAGGVGSLLGGAFGGGVGAAAGVAVSKSIGGLLGAGVGSLLPGIGTVIGGLAGAALGDLVGGLFGKKRKAEDHSADSLLKLALAAERVSESISNLPTGIKIAGYRFDASDPTMPAGTPRGEGKFPEKAFFIQNLTVNASNPMDFMRQLSSDAEIASARGGATGLTTSVTRTSRGY